MKVQLFLSAVSVLLISSYSFAADIAREVAVTESGNQSFAELGLSLTSGRFPLVGFNEQSIEESTDQLYELGIGIEFSFEYKGFFAEAIENSFSEFTLGYNAYSAENSQHEFVLTTLFEGAEYEGVVGLESIDNRDADFNGGYRGSYYVGNTIYQFEFLHDIVDTHNGVSASIHIGQQWQARNWNLHGLVGLRYFSSKVLDHYFGVSGQEATDEIPAYAAGDGLVPVVQVGAELPLDEKWIFRGMAEYARFPDSVVDSPLAQGDSTHSFQIGVYRVLYGS